VDSPHFNVVTNLFGIAKAKELKNDGHAANYKETNNNRRITT